MDDRLGRVSRLHGGVLLFALAIAWSSDRLRAWPLYLLVPLALHGVIVCAVPSLRGSAEWLKAGTIDRTVLTFTLLLAVAAPAALLCFQRVFQPSLPNFRGQLPTIFWSHPLLGMLVFSAMNALLEEVVFRGVLQDALVSALGLGAGVLVQGVAFGLSHAAGYPPGAGGAVLAAIYGVLLGVLKIRSRGLAAPIIAHFSADATIFLMVLRSG
jgi:membrane protease YdiL (CAAX protease family)